MNYRGYPDLRAGGLTKHDIPTSMELYAGSDPVTYDRGVVGSTALEQFRSLGRNASGLIVPWNPEARGSVGAAYAVGTLTYSGAGADSDTVTINGHVLTEKTTPAAAADFAVGADATHTAANLAAVINANVDLYGGTASAAAGVLTFTAKSPGTGGNAITTTESGTATAWGAATLASGTDVTASLPEAKLIGFAAEPAAAGQSVPYWSGGCFNYARMIWPINIVDLVQMQAACDGSKLAVGRIL